MKITCLIQCAYLTLKNKNLVYILKRYTSGIWKQPLCQLSHNYIVPYSVNDLEAFVRKFLNVILLIATPLLLVRFNLKN